MKKEGGENFIKNTIIFSLNNKGCKIQLGECRIQVPTPCGNLFVKHFNK